MAYGRGFDLKRYFEAFTFNMISRSLGAVMRVVLIGVGLGIEIFLFLGGIVILIGWLVLPLILIFGLIFGFRQIFL